MGHFQLTPDLQAFLVRLKEKTELVDRQGHLVGVFTPKKQAEAELEAEATLLFDLDEAKRRVATEQPGRTTQEVLQKLRGMESSDT
ncbi:MAG: hypothetical protein ACFCD0_11690 [Gemmataceae bacterium]